MNNNFGKIKLKKNVCEILKCLNRNVCFTFNAFIL